MQPLKTFFRTLVSSTVSPLYYADVLKARFMFSLKYFIVLQILFALAVTAFVVVPIATFDLRGLLQTAKTWYPQDLVVEMKHGRLSINKPLPYVIAAPESRDDGRTVDELSMNNIVVFDSDENISGAADVLAARSFVVLTETTAYVLDKNPDSLRTYSLTQIKENFRLNSQLIEGMIDKVMNLPVVTYKLYVPFIAGILLCLMAPMMVVFGLMVAAFYGLVIWFAGRLLAGPIMAGQLISYRKSVQVTLHSLTLITLVQFLLEQIGKGEYLQGWNYFGAFFVWTMFVLYQAHHVSAASSVQKNVAVASKASQKKGKK